MLMGIAIALPILRIIRLSFFVGVSMTNIVSLSASSLNESQLNRGYAELILLETF